MSEDEDPSVWIMLKQRHNDAANSTTGAVIETLERSRDENGQIPISLLAFAIQMAFYKGAREEQKAWERLRK